MSLDTLSTDSLSLVVSRSLVPTESLQADTISLMPSLTGSLWPTVTPTGLPLKVFTVVGSTGTVVESVPVKVQFNLFELQLAITPATEYSIIPMPYIGHFDVSAIPTVPAPGSDPSPNPSPINQATQMPTAVPTQIATAIPTPAPTAVPTPAPTAIPTPAPTAIPTPSTGPAPIGGLQVDGGRRLLEWDPNAGSDYQPDGSSCAPATYNQTFGDGLAPATGEVTVDVEFDAPGVYVMCVNLANGVAVRQPLVVKGVVRTVLVVGNVTVDAGVAYQPFAVRLEGFDFSELDNYTIVGVNDTCEEGAVYSPTGIVRDAKNAWVKDTYFTTHELLLPSDDYQICYQIMGKWKSTYQFHVDPAPLMGAALAPTDTLSLVHWIVIIIGIISLIVAAAPPSPFMSLRFVPMRSDACFGAADRPGAQCRDWWGWYAVCRKAAKQPV